MRADRLLSLMLLLQTRTRMTALELAEKLEVSERTIYRDLDALSAAGIPVYAERGPGGGCALTEDYRTNLTGLNEVEVRTLFMPGGSSPLAALGLEKPMEGALLKLLAALPSAHRRDAELARTRIFLDAAGWNSPEEYLPHLRTMQEALWQERKLGLVYRRSENDYSERVVRPLGLVAKATVWYLVAGVDNSIRVYRVSRISKAWLTEETFEYPSDFDLAAYWAEWLAQFKTTLRKYSVTFRVAPEGVEVMYYIFGDGVRASLELASPPDEQGWITLSMNFESVENARWRLLGLGSAMEVLEPAELRESMAQLGAELTNLYKPCPKV